MQSSGLREDKTMVNSPSIQQIQEGVRAALEAVMGDSSPEMLDEMSTIFLEDAVPLIEQIKAGFAAHDFKAITIAAHTLKGSSATIGLATLADLCLAIEASSKAEEINGMGPSITNLEAAYSRVDKALRHFLL